MNGEELNPPASAEPARAEAGPVDSFAPVALADLPAADLPRAEELPTDSSSADSSTADSPSDAAPAERSDASPSDPSPPDVRQRLIAQFEQWLDRMAAGEPAPEGLPGELLAEALVDDGASGGTETDLFTLFSAMTKLSGEIGLQGRAFKQVADALAPLGQLPSRFERVEAAQAEVADQLAAMAPEDEDEPHFPPVEDVLGVVLDLYDRLERGIRTLDASNDLLKGEASAGGWRRKLLGGSALAQRLLDSAASTRQGYQLTLSRLEGALRQWGVERVGTAGELFDPQRMNVIEVQDDPDNPDATILEVYRSGYELNGKLLVTAQVKVSRNAWT